MNSCRYAYPIGIDYFSALIWPIKLVRCSLFQGFVARWPRAFVGDEGNNRFARQIKLAAELYRNFTLSN
jgi:hypothetical protein